MQQTEKRGFNIIETSDAFSPQALNENTRKLEAALDEHEEAVAGQVDALDARVTVLEGHKVLVGCYIGDGSTRVIEFGFNPKVMIIYVPYPLKLSMLLQGYDSGDGARLEENGIWVANGGDFNKNGMKYFYVAII